MTNPRTGLTGFWLRWKSRLYRVWHGVGFLCDNCKLNYGNVCTRPERPNATVCEDFIAKS